MKVNQTKKCIVRKSRKYKNLMNWKQEKRSLIGQLFMEPQISVPSKQN